MMGFRKSILFYFFSIIFLFSILIILFPLFYWVGKDLKNFFYIENYIDWRVDNDIYSNYDNANQIFIDHKKISNFSQSFIVYKNRPLKSEFVNIINLDGISIRSSEPIDKNSKVWFFGGSTVFGDGVADNDTIPVIFENISGQKSMNFGLNAYTSRHQLNYFLNTLLEFKKPHVTIFLDGFNDVVVNCQSSKHLPTTVKEQEWHKIKNNSINNTDSFFLKFFRQPYQSLIYRWNLLNDRFYAANELLGNGCFNEDKTINYTKLDKIVENYCYNHSVSQSIANNLNIKFYSILQPNLLLSEARVDHINKSHPEGDDYLKKLNQLKPLLSYFYNNVMSRCNQTDAEIYDFTKLIDHFKENKMYIDVIHLGPAGNKLIANEIFKLLDIDNNINSD